MGMEPSVISVWRRPATQSAYPLRNLLTAQSPAKFDALTANSQQLSTGACTEAYRIIPTDTHVHQRSHMKQIAALLAVAALAVAAVACGDDDDESTPTASPASTSPAATSSAAVGTPPFHGNGRSIGQFVDFYDFLEYGELLDAALEAGDAQFFLDAVRFEELECDVEFPSPPATCEGQPAGATVPGIVVGVFQSEGLGLDEQGFEQFITEYLTGYDQDAPEDVYGGPAPSLYAYSTFKAELEEPPEGSLQSVHAITTRIAPGNCPDDCPELVPGQGRTALYLGLDFIGDKWQITHLHAGSVGYVDAFSPEAAEVDAKSLFEFWRRWEGR